MHVRLGWSQAIDKRFYETYHVLFQPGGDQFSIDLGGIESPIIHSVRYFVPNFVEVTLGQPDSLFTSRLVSVQLLFFTRVVPRGVHTDIIPSKVESIEITPIIF